MNVFSSLHFQPLHKSLDPSNLEHLITPLVTIGHIALLAPDQFAAPLKSLVATFIVKDLLMNDRVIDIFLHLCSSHYLLKFYAAKREVKGWKEHLHLAAFF